MLTSPARVSASGCVHDLRPRVPERVADGSVPRRYEGIDTVQKVFPDLLVEAQRCAIEKLSRVLGLIPLSASARDGHRCSECLLDPS